jgi:hypothetical protein
MFWRDSKLPLKGKSMLYVAIKQQGADLFSQIAIPLNF